MAKDTRYINDQSTGMDGYLEYTKQKERKKKKEEEEKKRGIPTGMGIKEDQHKVTKNKCKYVRYKAKRQQDIYCREQSKIHEHFKKWYIEITVQLGLINSKNKKQMTDISSNMINTLIWNANRGRKCKNNYVCLFTGNANLLLSS